MNTNNSLLYFIEDFLHYSYHNVYKNIPEELRQDLIINSEEQKFYLKSCALGLTVFHVYAKDYFDEIDSLYRLMVNLCLARVKMYPPRAVMEYSLQNETERLESIVAFNFQKNNPFSEPNYSVNNSTHMQNAYIINKFLQYSRILQNCSHKNLEGSRFLIDNLDTAVFYDLTGESIVLYENISLWNILSDLLCEGLMSIAEGNVYNKQLLHEEEQIQQFYNRLANMTGKSLGNFSGV